VQEVASPLLLQPAGLQPPSLNAQLSAEFLKTQRLRRFGHRLLGRCLLCCLQPLPPAASTVLIRRLFQVRPLMPCRTYGVPRES
jgi:hypothetical protein